MLRVEASDGAARLLDQDELRATWRGWGPDQVHRGPAGSLLLAGWDGLVAVDADRRSVRKLVAWDRGGLTGATTIALDGGWTVEVEEALHFDAGHTSIGSGSMFFAWRDDGTAPPAEERARLEREERRDLAAKAHRPRRRRVVVRRPGVEVVLLDEQASDAQGSAHLMWPPVAAPEGLLLRRARLSDTGSRSEFEALEPWFVAPDGASATWAVDGEPLGIASLCGLPSGGWLMPTHDLLWLDDTDGHLSVLRPGGALAPWLVGGERVTPSRVLAELAPDVLAAVHRGDPGWNDPWGFASARADPDGSRLHLALEVTVDGSSTALAVSAALDGSGALRLDGLVRAAPDASLALLP